MEREILLTGIGGQGIQLASQVLARAAVAEQRDVMMLGSYGGTMRGGSTESCLVTADAPIRTPPIVSQAWAALAMHDRFFAATGAKMRPRSVVFVNGDLFEAPVELPEVRLFPVPATSTAAEVASAMAASLVLAAAFAGATAFASLDALIAAMQECVPAYRQQHIESNERALRAGYDLLAGAAEPAWPGEATAA